MTKTRFLALVTALALLLTIPTAVFAQNARPHVFVGTATLDGAAAVDGTAVTAWVDGNQVAATNVEGGGYVLLVESATGFPNKTVIFRVGSATADQTAAWEEGGGDELNLTATSGAMTGGGTGETGGTGPAGPAGPRGATGATGPAGAAGADGAAGAKGQVGTTGSSGSGSPGPAGPAGAEGDDGGGLIGIIALIVAIVALVGAGGAYMMGRRA